MTKQHGDQRALPPGWSWTTLAEVADVQLGKMLDSKKQTGEHAMPYLRNVNVRWGILDLADLLTMDVHPNEVDRYTVLPGDLLVCEGGEPGRCAIVPPTADGLAYQKALHRIRPQGDVSGEYLALVLRAMAELGQLSAHMTGSTIRHLPRERIRALYVPLPPAAEQSRIVGAVSEKLTTLDAGLASLRRVSRLLQRLRHRLLLDAVAPNQEQLRGTSWVRVTLDDIAVTVKNGMFVSRPGSEPSGTPILRIGAVRPLALNLQDRRWTGLAEDDPSLEGFDLREDDLLFTRYNGNPDFVGACAVVPALTEAHTYPDKLIRVRLDPDKAFPLFVAMACAVGEPRAFIASRVKTTSGQTGIAGRDLRLVPLFLPPLQEQVARAQAAEAVLTDLHRTERQLALMERRLASLRRSLLASSVTGHLVEQDPTDEPADLLVKRIAESREGAGTARKKATRTVRRTRTTDPQEQPA